MIEHKLETLKRLHSYTHVPMYVCKHVCIMLNSVLLNSGNIMKILLRERGESKTLGPSMQ